MNDEFSEFEKYFSQKDDAQEIIRRRNQCPHCKEILQDNYVKEHPYKELPCPSCGSLIEISKIEDIELSVNNERVDERYDISLKVSYKNFDKFIVEYTKNVSLGGMFLHTKENHKIGSKLDLILEVPDLTEPIRLIAEVVHTKFFNVSDEDRGIGVKFIDIKERSRQQLVDYIKAQLG